jgi:hypothetical protein
MVPRKQPHLLAGDYRGCPTSEAIEVPKRIVPRAEYAILLPQNVRHAAAHARRKLDFTSGCNDPRHRGRLLVIASHSRKILHKS